MLVVISMKGISMTLNRSRNIRLAVRAVTAIGLLALGAAVAGCTGSRAQPARIPVGSGQQVAGSNERLRELTTERYEILKKILESLDKSFDTGRTPLPEWRDAKVALYMAKADLSSNVAEQIEVYEEIVDFLRSAEQLARRQADSGRLSEADVGRARLATIDAEIALERLRLSQTR
jgi:outer membrane protein TolC